MQSLHELLGDIVLRAESIAWDAAMAHYSTLKRVSLKDGAVASKLAPLVAMLATGRRKPAEETPAEPPPAAPSGSEAPPKETVAAPPQG